MFEVKYSKKILLLFSIVIGICITIIITTVIQMKTIERKWLVIIRISLPFLLIYTIGVVDLFRYKITVFDEEIIVTKTFSKKKKYLFEDVKYYYFSGNTLFTNFKDGKSIITNNFFINHKLLAQRIIQTGKLKKTFNFSSVTLDESKINDSKFTIKQKKTSLILISFFILFEIALIFLTLYADVRSDTTLLICMTALISFFISITLFYLVETLRFKISIDKENIMFVPVIGRRRYYKLHNILNIIDISSGLKIIFDDGKKVNIHYTFKLNIELLINLFTEIQDENKD